MLIQYLSTAVSLTAFLIWYLRAKTTIIDVVRVSRTYKSSYDYVIIGSGSSGCPLAYRLSEDDVSVLVLEAGPEPTELSEFPIAAFFLQKGQLDWNYTTTSQKHACYGLKNRENPWPRGFGLGGCSTINFNLFVRGNPSDYDTWERDGAKGWSWKDVLPYFLKLEDQTDPRFLREGLHTRGGPLTIETVKYVSPIINGLLAGARLFGYDTILLNGLKHVGFAIPQGTLRNGLRWSAAKAYLRPASLRSNVHVLKGAFVTKILFDDAKVARQVQFDWEGGQGHVVNANKEIILSAGVINSPQLLMLSGIGPGNHLRSLGIPVVADLPGVGRNLAEHVASAGLHFKVNKNAALSYPQLANRREEFMTRRTGPFMVLGGVETMGFIRTKYSNGSDDDCPDVQFHFVTTTPSSEFFSFRNMNFNEKVITQFYGPYLNKESVSFFPVLLQPRSRGEITLVSRNPYHHPSIDPHFLEDPRDKFVLAEAMKIGMEIGQSAPMKRYGSKLFQSLVPGCESFVSFSVEYWGCVVEHMTMGIYHPTGTCKMGLRTDPMAVVDNQLRVIGVDRLRVVDASVFPTPISGNTNVPCIMAGEKAADIIKKSRL